MKLSIFQEKEAKPDIFDRVGKDIFDRTELDPADKVLFDPKLQQMIAAEVAKAVAAIKIPEPAPVKETIREVRVEVPKKDTRDLVEKSQLDAALKEIATLKKDLAETDRAARSPIVLPGGSGVIGIPPPEASVAGYVLTVDPNKKAAWKVATGGSGSGLAGFTVSNGGSTVAFDAQNVTIDELASVVAQIISQLQA